MPIVHTGEADIFYTTDYFGHSETLLFSNSLGTDHTMWEPQIDMLSHHFNILRYDTRGHGQSSVPEGLYTIDQLGNDIIALLDHLGLEKVYFCGLSMGGQTGQWLGIHHPQRFEKIILANTAAKIGTAEGWATRIAQVNAHGLESITDGTAERWFTTTFREKQPEVVAEILEKFVANPVAGYAACCNAVAGADFTKNLYELEVPTLIISGLKDAVTTVEDGKYMAKRIPVSAHVSLDAAHLSNTEQAEEFSKHILHFTQH